jgi:hypothetical protein
MLSPVLRDGGQRSHPPKAETTLRDCLLIEEVRFAADSPLEGDGFEPSVPRQKDNAFRDSSFPTCPRATAAFENARRPVQQLLLPVVDPVPMNAELTRQLGDRPVAPAAATSCEPADDLD